MDYLGPDGGKLAAAFGAGCAAAWGFGQMILVRPLQKRVDELKADYQLLKVECEKREAQGAQRITQLETLLLLHGPAQLRTHLQAALDGEAA